MEINLEYLTREWIQFLKNNQIVKMQSNPKTGKLKYNRKPTVQELIRFLQIKTEYTKEEIRKAIRIVLLSRENSASPTDAQKGITAPPEKGDISTWQHNEMTPGDNERQPYREPLPEPEQSKKYTNDDAEDVEFRDVSPDEKQSSDNQKELANKKKPRYKYSGPGNPPTRISEDFYDRQGAELSEVDVKKIFKILLTPPPSPEEPVTQEPSPEEIMAQKQEYMRKLKQLVREVMTPQQRRSLWRVLSES